MGRVCFSATFIAKNNCYELLLASLDNRIISKPGLLFNPIALRKAKIVYNFGLSECSRVKERICSY